MRTLYLTTKAYDWVVAFSFLFAKDYCPYSLLFVCKGLLPLFPAISLGISCCPSLPLYVCKGLRPYFLLLVHRGLRSSFTGFVSTGLLYLFPLFVCKGLWPMFSAIRLERTLVLVFAIHLQRTAFWNFSPCTGFCLQRTDVPASAFLFAKDRFPCF